MPTGMRQLGHQYARGARELVVTINNAEVTGDTQQFSIRSVMSHKRV